MAGSVGADPRIGTEIAGYRIERLLGRGGMSVVYLAHDPRLDRRVALKLIAPELAEDGRFRERFLRESQLAASLDHPNVIPIFEAGEADGSLFIAMRYVEGTDLAKRLAQRGWLDPAEAVSIVERVADALDAAHKRGLVHRDVEPGNLLISGEGHVYLSDFGLTRSVEEGAALTETGQVVGTLDYVAPEQIQNQEVSARADVYSLACVLFQALTGEVPFRGDSGVGVIYAHLESEPLSASEVNPDLPQAVDGVLGRGMAKAPGDRYRSAGELAGEARAALGLSGELAVPVTSRRRSRRLALAGVVSAVVVVAALVPALVLTGGDEGVVGDDWSRVPHNQTIFADSTEAFMSALAADDSIVVAVGNDGIPFETAAIRSSASRGCRAWRRPRMASALSLLGSIPRWDSAEASRARSGSPSTASPGTGYPTMTRCSAGARSSRSKASVAGGPGFVAVGTEAESTGGFPILPWTQFVFKAGPIGRARGVIWTSADGLDWTRIPDQRLPHVGEENVRLRAISRGRLGLVAVGWRGPRDELDSVVWTSPDGETWGLASDLSGTLRDLGGQFLADVIPYGRGLVAAGADGSPDNYTAAV